MSGNRLLTVIACVLLVVASEHAAGLARTATGSNGAGAQAERRALEVGRPIERVITEGETQHDSLRQNAGEFVHVVIYQRGVNVAAALVGPDGKTLMQADSPNSTQERNGSLTSRLDRGVRHTGTSRRTRCAAGSIRDTD
jgi:hypothetical protein